MSGDPEQILEHAAAELDRLGAEIRALLASTRSNLIAARIQSHVDTPAAPGASDAPAKPTLAYTIAEAAELLRVSRHTVYRHQDEFHVFRIGGKKFVPSHVIEERLSGRSAD